LWSNSINFISFISFKISLDFGNQWLDDFPDANQILISSDAWMTARNEIKVKSVGIKRLKSGQDIEMLECV